MNDQTATATDSTTSDALREANPHIPQKWDEDSAAAACRKAVFSGDVSPDVVRQRIEAAQTAALEYYGARVITNMRDDVDVENYVPAILRISERDEAAKKNIVTAVFIGEIPSLAALWDTAQGQQFAQQAIADALLKQITTNVKREEELPYKLEAFTTPRGQEHEAWRKTKTDIVRALRSKKKMKHLDANTLEMCLRSQRYAESAGYSGVPGERWDEVIQMLIAAGKKNDWNTLGLEHWSATRYETELEFDDFDLEGLDSIFGSDSSDATTTADA